MNYDGVCRTAPATPGLLKTVNQRFRIPLKHFIMSRLFRYIFCLPY